jgi:hypothetical protein
MRLLLAPLSLCAAVTVRAQYPPLAPTTNTTIVVPSGVMHYGSIHIPAGVTVRFVAPLFGPASIPGMPAIVLCDGDAIVHGKLSLTGDSVNNDRPAGWVTTGEGAIGTVCGPLPIQPPEGGRHDYGSVLPFSLEGGSPGGDLWFWDSNCLQFQYAYSGGKGGGTLVLLAGGSIEIHGTVTADGRSSSAGGGSGGSIRLRGYGGVHVLPGGTVTARGGTAPVPPAPWLPGMSMGHDGHVRLDAWGAPPVVQGTVSPPPMMLQLPYLRAQSQPTVGTTWTYEIYAPQTGFVYVAAALAPGSGLSTPFGPLGVDVATFVSLGVTSAQPSLIHDPHVIVPWPIPNSPALVGFAMWLQALSAPQSLPARLTNTIAVVVQ